MILSISTSSPMASVALLREDGSIAASDQEEGRRNSSGAACRILVRLLEQADLKLEECTHIIADGGPGSFTGVRVGLGLAKALAYSLGVPVAVASSFDLIDPTGVVAVPKKAGEWFVRTPGKPLALATSLDGIEAVGYGQAEPTNVFPSAARAGELIPRLDWIPATEAMPIYGAEPSISVPKNRSILGMSHE